MKFKYLLLSCLIVLPLISYATPSGKEIAQLVYDRADGDSRKSEITMKLINKRGSIRERQITTYSIDVGKAKNDKKTVMFFTYPADVKGTGFLTWDYDDIKKEADRWLYLPAMKKTRRISGASAKKDFFMGSDFTYDDMGKRRVDEDTHTLLSEENIDGHQYWVLESTVRGSKDIYNKKISWINKDNLIPIKVDYYNKEGQLQRKLEFSDIVKVDGFWLAKKMQMTNVLTGHRTLLEVSNPQFNQKMDENKFTISTLEKGSF